MGDPDDPSEETESGDGKPDDSAEKKNASDCMTFWQRIGVLFFTAVIAAAFIIGILVILRTLHFLPKNLNAFKVETPVASFSIGQNGITLAEGPHKLTVINVPAYRMATPTGIMIGPNDKVTIVASGTIATSQGFDNWLSGTTFADAAKKDSTNVFGALQYSAFTRDANPNWRGPDGRRLFDPDGTLDHYEDIFASTNPLDKAIHETNEIHKLAPNKPYGLLMACIVDHRIIEKGNLRLIEYVTTHPERIFSIESSNSFNCITDGSVTRLHFPEPLRHWTNNGSFQEPGIIPMDAEKGELVLLVNDVVVTTNALGDVIKACGADEERKAPYLMASNIFGGVMAKNMNTNGISFDTFARELWYWDNVGSFTVTIDKMSDKPDEEN